MCHESVWNHPSSHQASGLEGAIELTFFSQRFAFYTTIPSFVIQLVLVAAALIAVSSSGAAPSRFRLDEEKGQELDDRVRTPGDYDAKTGSVHSVQDMERILGKH